VNATYACRTNLANEKPMYVSQLPARKGSKRAMREGVDWGYTHHSPGHVGNDAPIRLTPYWERRFRADMSRLNAACRFIA